MASNGYSNGIKGYWPAMGTAMAAGGCWPAIDTADAAMELMVAGQQWRKPRWLVVAGQQLTNNNDWPAMEAAVVLCVFARQQWRAMMMGNC